MSPEIINQDYCAIYLTYIIFRLFPRNAFQSSLQGNKSRIDKAEGDIEQSLLEHLLIPDMVIFDGYVHCRGKMP